jgi:hypothetical protein
VRRILIGGALYDFIAQAAVKRLAGEGGRLSGRLQPFGVGE